MNRRFVFNYFSIVESADFKDLEAKALIVEHRPEYGKNLKGTPPIFFFTPDAKKLLGTQDPFCTPDEFIRTAARILRENPEFDHPDLEEKALMKAAETDPESRMKYARLLSELGRRDEAMKILLPLTDPGVEVEPGLRAKAAYWLGHEARLSADSLYINPKEFRQMPKDRQARIVSRIQAFRKKRFQLATELFDLIEGLPKGSWKDLSTDIRMERAQILTGRREWKKALSAWKAIEHDVLFFPRKTELLYAKGLCYYHLQNDDYASYTWIRVLKEFPEGRYYQKARLAAMGPLAPSANPDLFLSGRPIRRMVVPGSDVKNPPKNVKGGFGIDPNGKVITEETPEKMLQPAYRRYHVVQRRIERNPELQP